MSGMLEGGWGYVWAAYIVTALLLGGYGARAFLFYKLGKRLGGHGQP